MSEGETRKQSKSHGIALIIICVLAVEVGVVFCFLSYAAISHRGFQEVPALWWVIMLVILPAGIVGLAKGLKIVTR